MIHLKNFSNHWLTNIIVDPKKTGGITSENIKKALLGDNIESRPLWKPMHLQPLYKECPYFGSNVSENLFKICIFQNICMKFNYF